MSTPGETTTSTPAPKAALPSSVTYTVSPWMERQLDWNRRQLGQGVCTGCGRYTFSPEHTICFYCANPPPPDEG